MTALKRNKVVGGRALLSALNELVLISLPIALYVTIEAFAKGDLKHLYASPEWSIATIFLAFQAPSLFQRCMAHAKRRPFEPTVGLVNMFSLVLIVSSSCLVYASIPEGGDVSMKWRLGLLAAAGTFFVAFVGAGKRVEMLAEETDATTK